MRWYYSKILKLYIDLDPLKLDKRVYDICEAFSIDYDYDTEKNICNIDFDDSRKLLEELGGQMLTLPQYWCLYEEAVSDGNTELLQSLTSDYFTEPLDRIYLSPHEFIDNPRIISKHEYDMGTVSRHDNQEYRPGWFLPDGNVDSQTGLPKNVNMHKNAKTAEWKFWTADLSVTKLDACFALRGYVTSVGRPSLDLGIPVDSKQPKQMLRECRTTPLTTYINVEYLSKIDSFIQKKVVLDTDGYAAGYKEFESLKSDKEWLNFLQSEDNETNILKELLLDKVGILNSSRTPNEDTLFKMVCHVDFLDYLKRLKPVLSNNINNKITFVIGHRNPDTDTVVSSLLEAYRNTLLYPDNIYIPIIQAESLPFEVRELLGDNISACLIFHSDNDYKEALKRDLYDYIFVDHNYQEDAQRSVSKIIDHHEVSDIAKAQNIPKTLKLVGSTTALVTLKYLGLEYNFDSSMLTIIYGAMLMDTENKVEHKMTTVDYQLYSYIENRITIDSDELYKRLSNKLISETDINILFNRDYKDFYNYGFAVIKTKDESIDKHIKEIVGLAKENNLKKSYPLTIVKIVIYNRDIDVIREIILFDKGITIPEQVIADVKNVITNSLELSFEHVKFIDAENSLTFYNIGKQLSRKKISTAIEMVIREYDTFIFMKSINKWVSRDFLCVNEHIKAGFPDIRYNSEGYINYCNYSEAKKLTKHLDYELLSLLDYWNVLRESKEIGDIRLENSLKHNK